LQTALRELKELDDLVREPALTPKPAEPVRRIRTLLVEDNPFESSLLASYLRMSGFEVDRVGDGQEALEYLETHEVPDAMLLDMHLPRFDGPSTVAAIRANPTWSKLKIIAVTGSRPEDLDLPNYVDGWFHKPLNPCQLVDSLLQSVA
jgi:CheY-like chemotaxis protein